VEAGVTRLAPLYAALMNPPAKPLAISSLDRRGSGSAAASTVRRPALCLEPSDAEKQQHQQDHDYRADQEAFRRLRRNPALQRLYLEVVF